MKEYTMRSDIILDISFPYFMLLPHNTLDLSQLPITRIAKDKLINLIKSKNEDMAPSTGTSQTLTESSLSHRNLSLEPLCWWGKRWPCPES